MLMLNAGFICLMHVHDIMSPLSVTKYIQKRKQRLSRKEIQFETQNLNCTYIIVRLESFSKLSEP